MISFCPADVPIVFSYEPTGRYKSLQILVDVKPGDQLAIIIPLRAFEDASLGAFEMFSVATTNRSWKLKGVCRASAGPLVHGNISFLGVRSTPAQLNYVDAERFSSLGLCDITTITVKSPSTPIMMVDSRFYFKAIEQVEHVIDRLNGQIITAIQGLRDKVSLVEFSGILNHWNIPERFTETQNDIAKRQAELEVLRHSLETLLWTALLEQFQLQRKTHSEKIPSELEQRFLLHDPVTLCRKAASRLSVNARHLSLINEKEIKTWEIELDNKISSLFTQITSSKEEYKIITTTLLRELSRYLKQSSQCFHPSNSWQSIQETNRIPDQRQNHVGHFSSTRMPAKFMLDYSIDSCSDALDYTTNTAIPLKKAKCRKRPLIQAPFENSEKPNSGNESALNNETFITEKSQETSIPAREALPLETREVTYFEKGDELPGRTSIQFRRRSSRDALPEEKVFRSSYSNRQSNPKPSTNTLVPAIENSVEGAAPISVTVAKGHNRCHRFYPIDASKDADIIATWKSFMNRSMDRVVPPCNDTSISVSLMRRGKTTGDSVPVIRIQTSNIRSEQQKEEIRRSIREHMNKFPLLEVIFVVGSVKRTARRSDLDAKHCTPRNTGFSSKPPMGVSIGVGGSTRDTATLGGYIYIDNTPYVLTVHHLFTDDESGTTYPPGTTVTQPSWQEVKEFSELWERIRLSQDTFHEECVKKIFESMKSCLPAFSFGCLSHSSGYRGRISRNGTSHVEMDWAICKVDESRRGYNITPCSAHWCRGVTTVVPNREIMAVGRTSGQQEGIVDGCPRFLSLRNEDGTYRHSEEWAIFSNSVSAESNWVTSGIGVSGDSGAWVLEKETSNVIGLIWGRDYEEGEKENDGEIFTYFTPILDIFDDIRELTGATKIAISTERVATSIDHQREQHAAQDRITNDSAQSQSALGICRICNKKVSINDPQSSASLLDNEIEQLNMARQRHQVVLKLRGMGLCG
jgi:hypothetical protein